MQITKLSSIVVTLYSAVGNGHISPFSRHSLRWGLYCNYRIYPYKRPLPINRPPLFSTFAKFIFRGFTSLSTATSLAIPGFQKKMCFSISPIEYRLREIKKITTKHGNFDHRWIKICKKIDKSL